MKLTMGSGQTEHVVLINSGLITMWIIDEVGG